MIVRLRRAAGRLRHRLAHALCMNLGSAETFWEPHADGLDRLMVGFRCAGCGRLMYVHPSPTAWQAALVECRVCTHRHAAVAPYPPGVDGGECPRCGAMACDAVDAGDA